MVTKNYRLLGILARLTKPTKVIVRGEEAEARRINSVEVLIKYKDYTATYNILFKDDAKLLSEMQIDGEILPEHCLYLEILRLRMAKCPLATPKDLHEFTLEVIKNYNNIFQVDAS